jgi:hypothetical protein
MYGTMNIKYPYRVSVIHGYAKDNSTFRPALSPAGVIYLFLIQRRRRMFPKCAIAWTAKWGEWKQSASNLIATIRFIARFSRIK